MIIDFKEIPSGNTGGDGQDQFELFCRDFLKKIGFEIIQHPSRGPDGKKDMIVKGKIEGGKEIIWLVSCKHFAHGNRSVKDSDEINITERIVNHKCKGFLGMYSTIAASSLSNLLHGNKTTIISEVFDHRRIEDYIINNSSLHETFFRYFTESYNKHKSNLGQKHSLIESSSKTSIREKTVKPTTRIQKNQKNITEEDILRISKTALIILEIDKIKDEFSSSEWEEREEIIDKLNRFYEHTNPVIAEHVFRFLSNVAGQTRSGMTEGIAISIYSMLINFFPYSEDKRDKQKIIHLANECVNISFCMVYDAAIKIKNYEIMMYGLTILKYLYKKGKEEGITEISKKVDDIYTNIERNLKRPERTDLGDALELVLLFKADRKEGTLVFPPLTERLHNIIH